MRVKLGAVVVLVVAAVAAGCGGDDATDASATEQWADGVCTAFSSWSDALGSAVDSVTSGGVSTDALESAVGDVKSATDSLADDLESLGRPDTEAGAQAEETVSQLADDLRTGVGEIESAVEGVSGNSGVVTAATAIGTTLSTMGTQVQTAFAALEALDGGDELTSAFESASSCSALQDGS
jgi:hypothetical protein